MEEFREYLVENGWVERYGGWEGKKSWGPKPWQHSIFTHPEEEFHLSIVIGTEWPRYDLYETGVMYFSTNQLVVRRGMEGLKDLQKLIAEVKAAWPTPLESD